MPLARWSLLTRSSSVVRSSHCLSVSKGGLLIAYGGELKPRVPVDNEQDLKQGVLAGSVHTFDILNKSAHPNGWNTVSPNLSVQSNTIPVARVGATTVFDDGHLYLWGGRGGVDMAPLPDEQMGFFRGKLTPVDGTTPTPGISWEFVPATNPEAAPDPRSYHSAVSNQGKIYIHAGCPTTGRLSSLHSFDVLTRTWKPLASAPDPGRGGTALAVATLPGTGPVLLRYGGFSGHQLPEEEGIVDIYVVGTNEWHTVRPSPDPTAGSPGARSVHGFVPFQSRSPTLSGALALLYHGERDASNLGHAGAGVFWEDVWLLSKNQGNGISEGWSWGKVEIPAEGAKPEARGWFPPASWVDGNGETRAYLHGGLLSSNDRSGELWELVIV